MFIWDLTEKYVLFILVSEDGFVSPTNELFYFMNNVPCGLRDEEHTVAEWLGEFNLQESETWFMEWSKVLGEIAFLLQQLEIKLSPRHMEPVFSAVFTGLYLNYYAGSGFMEQFKENSAKVKQMLKKIMAEVGGEHG